MKKLNITIAACSIVLLSAFTFVDAVNWKISESYNIEFKGVDAEGIFKTMQGDLAFDENDLAGSSFNVAVDVASINTGNGMKNKHAVGKKWFDAETHPKITFASETFTKSEVGYNVSGKLSMHGVTKTVSIPFTFKDNTFKGAFKVNRLDYGVGTMKGMSKKVGNEIAIALTVPVTKK